MILLESQIIPLDSIKNGGDLNKIDRQTFIDTVSEVAYMFEKQKKPLLDLLQKTHPAVNHFFESIERLSFHEPTLKTFEKLKTSAENAVLAFFIIAKNNPLKKPSTAEDFETILDKNKEDFENLTEKIEYDTKAINDYLSKSSQPDIYTLLYLSFPNIAENQWDKSIAFLIFIRVKTILDCLSNSY